MDRNQIRTLARLLIGVCLFLPVAPLSGSLPPYIITILFLLPYIVIGGDVLLRAARNIVRGQVFDENFLMCVATVGAILLGEYTEAVAVMLFYQVGELFQGYALGRSRRSIEELMDIRPDYANVERDGVLVRADPEEVAPGDVIVVAAGERVPLDGVVLEGSSQLDTAALTGEALPRDVAAGDGIVSGSVNLSGLLRIRVSKPFGESTVARILELIESAGDKKARVENFITRFARYYTPAVLGIAAVLALAPPLLLSLPWRAWMERGLIFLVVSCPCALVISVPLSFFGGIGSASRRGILVKGSNYLELLANVGTVIFDKTGTLTQGTFSVTAVHPQGLSEARLLELAAHAESFSSHPISLSVRAAYPGVIDRGRVSNVAEHAGHGVTAAVDGLPVAVGNAKLMAQVGVACRECRLSGTAVHLAADGAYGGHIVLADTLKPDARAAITALRALGVRKTVLLTGDKDAVARETADALGVDTYHAGLLPQDKVALVERMLDEMPNNAPLAFVGDGINDAPVLARADVGIAMGAMGSDAAIEAADIVLMDDKPSNIPVALRIARKTRSIVRQNIVLALGIKFLVLALAAFGASTMWQAVFADVGVAVIAILNAMRALRIDNG